MIEAEGRVAQTWVHATSQPCIPSGDAKPCSCSPDALPALPAQPPGVPSPARVQDRWPAGQASCTGPAPGPSPYARLAWRQVVHPDARQPRLPQLLRQALVQLGQRALGALVRCRRLCELPGVGRLGGCDLAGLAGLGGKARRGGKLPAPPQAGQFGSRGLGDRERAALWRARRPRHDQPRPAYQ